MHFSFDQSVPVFLAGIDMNQGGPGSQPSHVKALRILLPLVQKIQAVFVSPSIERMR